MQIERMAEIVMDMPAGRFLQIAVQVISVKRMRTVIDNCVRPLHRRYPTQIGNPLFGHDHFNAMFAVVDMAAHRYDG